MYKISLKDLGRNRVTKDVNASVDTIEEAEVYAIGICKAILGYTEFRLQDVRNADYVITKYDILVGSLTITKLS